MKYVDIDRVIDRTELILKLYQAFDHIVELGKCRKSETSITGLTEYQLSKEDHPRLARKVGQSIIELCRADGGQPGIGVLEKMHQLLNTALTSEFGILTIKPWQLASAKSFEPDEVERLTEVLTLLADVDDTLQKQMQAQAETVNAVVADLPALLAQPYKMSPFAQAVYDRLVEESRRLSKSLAESKAVPAQVPDARRQPMAPLAQREPGQSIGLCQAQEKKQPTKLIEKKRLKGRNAKIRFAEFTASAAATFMAIGLLFLSWYKFEIPGLVLAIVVAVPGITWSLFRLVKWMERPFFKDGCLYTGHLYTHPDGSIDAEIMPDGQSTRANALLLLEGQPAWLVHATTTNGIANVRRVKQLEGAPPMVKYMKLEPYQLY